MKFVDILKVLRENKSSKKMLLAFYKEQFSESDEEQLKREVDIIYKSWRIEYAAESIPKY